MGFLIAKILFLLILAAVCGALLTYWWFRRRYEDITLEYTRWQEQLAGWRGSFEERLAARPEVDLRPLWEQVASVDEAVRGLPEPRSTDLTPVLEAIARIRLPDLEPVQLRLGGLEARVAQLEAPVLDLRPLIDRLDELKARLEHPPAQPVEVLRHTLEPVHTSVD